MGKILVLALIMSLAIFGFFLYAFFGSDPSQTSQNQDYRCTEDCQILCSDDLKCCLTCVPSSCSGDGKDVDYYFDKGFKKISDIEEITASDKELIESGRQSDNWSICENVE